MTEPMIKGGVLREFVEWYEAEYGKERMRELAQKLPADLHSYVDPDTEIGKLLAASWYPVRVAHVILDAATEGASEREIERLCHDSNRWLVKRGMSSIYRLALRRLVTPEMYALSVPRLWRQFHSTGDRTVKVQSRTSALSTVTGWGGHHPVLCTIVIETMCAIFETMGCKNVTWKRTSCVSRGASECITQLTWT